jgi:hypothetical protein
MDLDRAAWKSFLCLIDYGLSFDEEEIQEVRSPGQPVGLVRYKYI